MTKNADLKTVRKLIRIYETVEEILSRIAEEESTNKQILAQLSKLHTGIIITPVALNPNTPDEILINLLLRSEGGDEETRVHILSNPSLKINSLKKIIKEDPSEYVSTFAVEVLLKRLEEVNSSKEISEFLNLIIQKKAMDKKVRNYAIRLLQKKT